MTLLYSAIRLKFWVDLALKLELSITVTLLYSAKSLKFYVDLALKLELSITDS